MNSFLQNLDSLGPQTIVLAATNHEELLDRAVWRRFSYRLKLDFPSLTERAAMWSAFLKNMQFTPREIALLADLSEGFSGSDIQEAALRLHRKRVTSHTKPALSDAFRALQNLATGEGENGRRFFGAIATSSPEEIASVLRAREPKLYSHAAIARLLGVSKTTAFRLAAEGEAHE